MNSYFANYVREASFNLALSSEMIDSLLHLDHELNLPIASETHERKRDCAVIYSKRTSTALYRRGLVVPTTRRDFPDCWLNAPAWPYYYELTTAGNLVVGLLKEAGFKLPELAPYEAEEIEDLGITLKPINSPPHEPHD